MLTVLKTASVELGTRYSVRSRLISPHARSVSLTSQLRELRVCVSLQRDSDSDPLTANGNEASCRSDRLLISAVTDKRRCEGQSKREVLSYH